MHLAGKLHKVISGHNLELSKICFFILVDTLPFGGVGPSGLGMYHGKFTFDALSQKRACLIKKLGWISETLGK